MAIWKITDKGPVQVAETHLREQHLLEEHLEDWIVANHAMLEEHLLVIGRQVQIPEIRDRIDIQPRTIIPQPVSRFSDTGRPKAAQGSRPWIDDGKGWHLDRRCSPETQKMLLRLDDLIRDNFDVEGPRWSQKFYVAYRIGNANWLAIVTRSTQLTLDLLVIDGEFVQEELAHRLGVASFDQTDSLSEKIGLPSSVLVTHRNDTSDRVILRIKEDFDLESEAFLQFLRDAYNAFPR